MIAWFSWQELVLGVTAWFVATLALGMAALWVLDQTRDWWKRP